MSDRAHSQLGGSVVKRYRNCPGSVALNATFPDPPESEYAREGTRAHFIAQQCLEDQEQSAERFLGVQYFDEQHGPWTVTPEMVAAVDVYLEAVYSVLTPDDELYVELQLDLSSVYPGMFGTSDCIIAQPAKRHMHVFDYKHGAGVPVEIVDNEQTKFYALGALKKFPLLGISRVTCWIVQPRCAHPDGPVRFVTYDVFDLMDWQVELRTAAQRTADPSAPRVAGPWCQFCKAADAQKCPEFRGKALAVAAGPFGEIITPDQVSAFDARELGRRLEDAPLLKAYIDKLYAYADEQARAGNMPIGVDGQPYKWVAGRGQRYWLQSEIAVLAQIQVQTGKDISERVCPSPAQTEKILGKATYENAVAPLVGVRHAAPKLVKASNPKPAISLEEVRTASKGAVFDVIALPD